jgi:hypothetical protein
MMALYMPTTFAQAPSGSILHVELEKSTLYTRGYCSPPDQAMNSNKLPTPAVTALIYGLAIGDIVSVNGQPVKGTAMETINGPLIRPVMSPGTAIGDYASGASATSWELCFLNLDGTAIGTVHIDGNGAAAAAGAPLVPGAPKEILYSTWAVTGGTGAFFGARGLWEAAQDSVSGERRTTDCEDPAYRRINADPGGNKRHGVLWLVPLEQPQIVVTGGVPAVYHSDLTLVTAAKPAAAGEVLIAMATGLGPTRPGVDPGQPFPLFPGNPLQAVNSPVGVTVNQQPADVINAFGWPGLVDTYRVDLRVPDGTTAGQVSLQLSSAWIAGRAVNIPVQ